MKKTLLAAAMLVGFAGAAHAQSSVTLYGIVDGGLDYRKYDGKKIFGVDTGLQAQSRFGMRGVEDLGNGLKAVFFLENGFFVDDGTQTQGRLFGRQAQVGLDSATAGRLLFGRVTNLAFGWASATISPFALSFGTANLGTTFAYQDGELAGGRSDNTVYYYSPVISGFQGAIGYSTAIGTTAGPTPEVAGSGNNNRLIDAAVRYDNGPIHGIVSYQYVKPSNGTVNYGNFRNLTVGGNYDFGFLTAFVGYNKVNNLYAAGYQSLPGSVNTTNTGFVTAGRNDDNAYTLGLTVPVGPGKVYAAYAKATSSKVRNYAVGYTYDLSKRTNLYTYYSNTEIRNFTQDRNIGGQQYVAGIQHRF